MRMMLALQNTSTIESVLEPSAGRGDIIEYLMSSHTNRAFGAFGTLHIDAIEQDMELAAVLSNKGYRPVHDDFLTFESYRRYDAIVMNPPFADGDAHLLKALEVQKNGGQVVCIINAESLKNPYTNRRKELTTKLEELGASVEYIQDGFVGAVRATEVEVALVHVNVPRRIDSDILQSLKRADDLQAKENRPNGHVVESSDYIDGAIRRYTIEIRAGLKLIDEYQALRPYLSTGFGEQARPALELSLAGERGNLSNGFVGLVRKKFWSELFKSDIFAQMFTEKTRAAYREQVSALAYFEFDLANIKQMQIDLSTRMLETLDEAVTGLFDEFSNQYWDESSKNIHYYNGWKTNKAWRVNRKVITRMDAWFFGDYSPATNATERLADIDKVFGYLDGAAKTAPSDLRERLHEAARERQSRGLDFEYFTVDFYKKGTAHITFKSEDLLKKFNLVGSMRKGWLPPAYGVKSYEAMTEEERRVVDQFEGAESYTDTKGRHEFYLGKPAGVLSIGSGAIESM